MFNVSSRKYTSTHTLNPITDQYWRVLVNIVIDPSTVDGHHQMVHIPFSGEQDRSCEEWCCVNVAMPGDEREALPYIVMREALDLTLVRRSF